MLREDRNIPSRASVILKDENQIDTVVMNLNANLNPDFFAYTISCDVINKEMYLANATSIQADVDQFKTAVRTEAESNGFVVFI